MKELLDRAETPDDIVSLIHLLLDKLIYYPDSRIRRMVASDPNLTLHHQMVLASDWDDEVYNILHQNPCLHATIREQMLSSPR